MSDFAHPDYDWLPQDVKDFITRTEASYPADAVNFTIAQQRAFYDKLCAEFDAPYPAGLSAQDELIAGVPCRRYRPSAPRAGVTALYFHGGGFIVGGLHSHDSICAELAEGAQVELVSVDYRLAPEHRHPAAHHDALAVFDAIGGTRILVGDSAGGNLCAGLAAVRPEVAGQILIYPGLGGERTLPSYTRHAKAPMLTTADVDYYGEILFEGARPRDDVTASPLCATDYRALPRTVIFTAQCDPLASDGAEYAARLAEAGVDVALTEEPGLVHGYLRARGSARQARDSFARITQALSDMVTRVQAQ
ncbi:MAG: alpha/beta hydrolase [Paracoccaceae bacterium]